MIPVDEVIRLKIDETVILTTGNQGEPVAALQKMAKQTHKQVTIEEEDTVINCSISTLEVDELISAKTIDMLNRVGADVV